MFNNFNYVDNSTFIMFQDVKKWNDGWKSGDWNYMAKVPIELSRNALSTAVYANLLCPRGAILDLGCAEGY